MFPPHIKNANCLSELPAETQRIPRNYANCIYISFIILFSIDNKLIKLFIDNVFYPVCLPLTLRATIALVQAGQRITRLRAASL